MQRARLVVVIVLIICIVGGIGVAFLLQNPERRAAIILCSANDVHADVDIPLENPSFEKDISVGWDVDIYTNGTSVERDTTQHVDGNSSLHLSIGVPGGHIQLYSTSVFEVFPGEEIFLSVWIKTQNVPDTGAAYIGIQWLNGTSVPPAVILAENQTAINGTHNWTYLSVTASAPENATHARVILGLISSVSCDAWVDGVYVSKNNEIVEDSDAFPAMSLLFYSLLKKHGYLDENILFMMYNNNNPDVDFDGDGKNDLEAGIVDRDNISRSDAIMEMQKFANGLDSNDRLLVYMVDHGGILPNGTAGFWFERDDKFLLPTDFNSIFGGFEGKLVVLLDFCYAGAFASGLSLKNAVIVSAAGNTSAWYWCSSPPWPGSWFFHEFFLNADNGTSIVSAFNATCDYVPTQKGRFAGMTVYAIQDPQLLDTGALSQESLW